MSKPSDARQASAASKLRGVEKVTALLLLVGKVHAQGIIRQFEDSDIRALAMSAANLPEVQLDTIDALIDELAGQLEGRDVVQGSSDGVEELLNGAVSIDLVDDIMDELTGQPPRRIWSRLTEVSSERIASVIAAEQPQIAAFVLSNLTSAKASEVMEKLDPDACTDLSRRLLSIKPIGQQAARLIANRLAEALLGDSEGDDATSNSNRHARLGAILNNLERNQLADILKRLDQVQPEDARIVKQYIFTFEDIIKLSAEDRVKLFDEVPAERVVLSLRACEPSLKESILAALSPRSRRLVEAELSTEATAQMREVIDAQRAISNLALTLAEKALIKIAPDNEAADN